MLASRRIALYVGFIALGMALSTFSIPIGPAKVFPFQHMINVLVAVLLGPLDAMLVALVIGILRNAFGLGTVLAITGLFGGLVVGVIYHYVWRKDVVALFETVGTAGIGGIFGVLLLSGLSEPTMFFGFMQGKPLADTILGFPGAIGLPISFAVSSIPGSILGLGILTALRQAGIAPEDR
ncbi:MAG: energy coupling factor transporter S component ThiW [Chloroflexi bacterium]|nr:energy coupling factor transporter S component ThiW [Chloroflexota bacterium]